jgi:hypothetical protein
MTKGVGFLIRPNLRRGAVGIGFLIPPLFHRGCGSEAFQLRSRIEKPIYLPSYQPPNSKPSCRPAPPFTNFLGVIFLFLVFVLFN